jgi:hypothetical protein
LAATELGLRKTPTDLDLKAERAGLLAALGQVGLAKAIYLELLTSDPTHFTALNNFGSLLYETDFRTAARTVFTQAVKHHPDQPMAHVNLANLLMYADDPDGAKSHYDAALALDPGNVFAHQRLSELLRDRGDLEGMRRHRRLGFGPAPVCHFPYMGGGKPIALLLLVSTPGADLGWKKLVDDAVFAPTTLVAEFHDPALPLPPHDLIFNTIGDADVSDADLQVAERLLRGSTAPRINAPEKVRATGRLANADRLGRLPGVRAPNMAVMTQGQLSGRDAVETLRAQGFGFPLLLRSPGFHTGRHFARVDASEDLARAVATLPGPDLLAIEYLDARGPDGHACKYRVMLIDGALYPLHMAMSHDWKVHYFTGAMSGNADFQMREARFLTNMGEALGEPAMAALRAIQASLGLDYAGVDFGLDSEGRLLLFEANAVMNIVVPDASPQWDYRRPAIHAAIAAARAMIRAKAQVAAQVRVKAP